MTLPNWKTLPTDEKREAVIKLLRQDGLSSAQVSEHFENANRSAVIGFCSRQKIPLNNLSTHNSRASLNQTKTRAPKAPRKPRASGTDEPRPSPYTPKPVPLVSDGVPFLEIKHGQCRSPQWEDGMTAEEKRYCGEAVVEGEAYCRFHLRRYTNPVRR